MHQRCIHRHWQQIRELLQAFGGSNGTDDRHTYNDADHITSANNIKYERRHHRGHSPGSMELDCVTVRERNETQIGQDASCKLLTEEC